MKTLQATMLAGLTLLGGSTLGACKAEHDHHEGQRHGDGKHSEEDEEDEHDEKGEGDEEGGEDEADKKEEVIAFTAAPEAVRTAFAKLGTADSVKKVERITEDEATSFEINYMAGTAEASVTLSDRGDVMEVEGAAGELPDAVKRAIEAEMKGAKVVGAERVQLSYFEVMVERNGKKHEVKIFANGKIEEVD